MVKSKDSQASGSNLLIEDITLSLALAIVRMV